MALRPPTDRFHERILAIGASGAGKSTAGLEIAKRLPDGSRMFVLDTDAAWGRMLWDEGIDDRVVHLPAYDWSDYEKAARTILDDATPADWVVIDMASAIWAAAQAHFVEDVFGTSVADHYIQARKNLKPGAKSLEALQGWTDWSAINAAYRDITHPLFFKLRAHLLTITGMETLGRDEADKSMRLWFGAHGIKPAGQKNLAHSHHTVLMFGESPPGTYWITSIKDRKRKYVERKEIRNFVTGYLVHIAGWRP